MSDLSHDFSPHSQCCVNCAVPVASAAAQLPCEPSTDDSAFGPVAADYLDEMVEF